MKLSGGTKGKVLAAIILFAVTTNVFAQKPAAPKSFEDRIVKTALYGMSSEIPSIVEASLFVLLEVKNKYPNEDYKKLLDKLNELAQNGSTLSIKYKAQLTSLFINYHDLFRDVTILGSENPDLSFKMIASKVENYSLTLNNN
ncbi:MAG: hypothetical protein ACYC4T_04515 [Melioribacteraceae bacterium]